MKRIIIPLAVLATVIVASFAMRPVHAEVVITEQQIERIKNTCVENQATLNRLHQTDAFLRNDRGNLYRTINDKLMTPFNRRLGANELDASDFLAISTNFNTEYSKFYDAYTNYDNAMVKLLATDCTKQPVSFYNALLDARDKRAKLSKANQAIITLIKDYQSTFEAFKASFLKESQ